jgi:hypothetical protein
MHSLYFAPDGTLIIHLNYEQEFALSQFIKLIVDSGGKIPPGIEIHRDDNEVVRFGVFIRDAA